MLNFNVIVCLFAYLAALLKYGNCIEPLITITKSVPPENSLGVINAEQGQDVTLTCYAENVNSDLVNVIWQRIYRSREEGVRDQQQDLAINTDLTDNTKFSVDKPTTDSWRLRIKNIQIADTAEYRCFVRVTLRNIKEDVVYINVQVAPRLDPSMTSSNLERKVGDTVTLGCNGTGLPQPLVKWTRLGGAPLPSPINREEYNEDKMTLTNLRAEDRGTYRCMIINAKGHDKRDIKLDIKFAPIVRTPHPVISQAKGYQIELQCLVESNPMPADTEIAWIKGSRTISLSTKSHMVKALEGAFHRLTYEFIIHSVSDDDYGQYQCRIKNNLGTSYGTIRLEESNEPRSSFKLGRIVKGDASHVFLSRVSIVLSVLLITFTLFVH